MVLPTFYVARALVSLFGFGVAAYLYACWVTMLVWRALRRGYDPWYARLCGRAHVRACMLASQRATNALLLYDPIMRHEARRALATRRPGVDVCALGDSVFALWRGMEEALARFGVTTFNAGFGGATSAHVARVARELSAGASLALLHVGANDYDLGVNLAEAQANVARILDECACPILLLRAPPSPSFSASKVAYLHAIATYAAERATAHQSRIVDLTHATLEYHVDGIHATSASCDRSLAPLLAAHCQSALAESRSVSLPRAGVAPEYLREYRNIQTQKY